MAIKKSSGKDGAPETPLPGVCHPVVGVEPFLGHAAAVVIVCNCGNTSPVNLPRTLAELGVDGLPFQQCVNKAVRTAGYAIRIDDIPNAPQTRLIQVVTVIQNAPRVVLA
jgi:hypothetical protein